MDLIKIELINASFQKNVNKKKKKNTVTLNSERGRGKAMMQKELGARKPEFVSCWQLYEHHVQHLGRIAQASVS